MTQEPRYYYTDALAAAWMAKHFGMFFDNDCAVVALSLKDAVLDEIATYKAYIHPDSLYLLKPQQWDLVEHDGISYGLVTDYDDDEEAAIQYDTDENGVTRAGLAAIDDLVIIQRNGIAFMWPESEVV